MVDQLKIEMIENRMKCSLDELQVENRLLYSPTILELHLHDTDLLPEGIVRLRKQINYLQEKGITVYLHHPMRFEDAVLDILHKEKRVRNYYQKSSQLLYQVCKEYGIQCVIHCHYAGTESSLYMDKKNTIRMKDEIEKIITWSEKVFLWENTIEGLFSFHNPYLLEHLIKPLHLPLVHDTSHTFIGVKGDNEKLHHIAKAFDPYVHYLHVVDSVGMEHDGLELGKGKINWTNLIPFIEDKPFIYEVVLENQNDAAPMARSATYLHEKMKATD